MLNAKPETQKKKVTVAVKLRPATFYTLEGWLLLGGANLPEPSTLASFLENFADTWARDVINQNPAEAGQLRSLRHLPLPLRPVDADPKKSDR